MRNEWYQKNGRKTGTVDLKQLFILSYFIYFLIFSILDSCFKSSMFTLHFFNYKLSKLNHCLLPCWLLNLQVSCNFCGIELNFWRLNLFKFFRKHWEENKDFAHNLNLLFFLKMTNYIYVYIYMFIYILCI